MVSPEEVLSFWLDDIGPKGWYDPTEDLDQQIADRFMPAWEKAQEGAYGLWLTYPSGTLAYIILMDQFPRNMFRGDPRSFSTDRNALAAAKSAIYRKWDLKIDEPARQFFYLPLMHSENLCNQDHCVRLICERLSDDKETSLLHARAHREVIRQFGRFPYRNQALDRVGTAQEQRYIDNGGYAQTVADINQATAA